MDNFVAPNYRRRKYMQILMFSLAALSALVGGIAVLFIILGYVIYRGIGGINLHFFTHLPTPVGVEGGGMKHALIGSFYLVGLASLLAVPLGVFAAVYLSEYGRGKLAVVVRFMSETMTGIPSIVMGMFAYTIIVLPMKSFSTLAGSLALALLMLPIIIKSTEEMLRLVPQTLREASLALGIPRWKTTTRIVLRGARPGIVTAVLLALARVGGEAAPLLFTALGNNYLNLRLTQPMASLPVQLYVYAISPYADWHQKAWAAALVLLTIVLFVNITAKIYVRKKL
jgi:phosphate transport system permease protein